MQTAGTATFDSTTSAAPSAPASGEVLVETRGLRQRFGAHVALDGVELRLGAGVFGLLGPNGAGKTTLLRTLATILPPDEGEVRLLGCDPRNARERREIRRRLGYLPQALGYYPNFTVAEFVEYFALLKEVPAREVSRAVARAIAQVDLESKARAKLKTLSGGMLRRAGLAQAIVNQPRLLLLDELTAGLDPAQRVGFRALLRELGERHLVIVSTHLIEDVAAACSEVALLDAGRVAFRGTTEALQQLGSGGDLADGDSVLERGYMRALRRAGSGVEAGLR